MTTAQPPAQPTPSEAEAYARADEHIGDAVVALATRVRLERGIRNAVAFDAGELGPSGLVDVEVSYTLEDLPDDVAPAVRNDGYFDRLKDFWTGRGYVVEQDTAAEGRPQPPGYRALRVRHPADACRVSLRQGRTWNLWITAALVAVADEEE